MRILAVSCVLVAFLCLSVATASEAEDKSLVLYLTFDEGEGNTVGDSSSYHNDGLIKGDPEWVEGRFGSSLKLDGTGDTVEVAHHESLNITTAVTMELWVKAETAGGDINQPGIEKGLWAVGEYGLYVVYSGSTLAQFNDLPDVCDDENVGRTIRDNEWHHLAGVWNGKEIALYIDGVKDKTTACAGELSTNTNNLYIGSRDGIQRFLIGIVDEVRVYNRALEIEEIQEDMVTLGNLSVSPSDALATCWGKVKRVY